ncbi:MAG: chorismate synthase [Armatimonadetes bacterium]|nr:chorismate synthase [Armatimonadota bacterium]NIM23717.1 chorismate synthase [Armatimonadota bacterium]NIM67594.1 chorismate synthase [Armatimonadota bacterium]NIM76117.1 chorismate synthase [Armatimonadota bacterium]NIN05800.1 chorismate synthase [Armatimonadota bacterium]
MRLLTAGESHGQALLAIVDGLPAGLHISQEDLDRDLRRRQLGYGRGKRMEIEQDRARLLSGARFGKTLGTPIALLIENRDWPSWQDKMNPLGSPPEGLEEMKIPRPGHADLAGHLKFGFSDLREVLERASARETAARVAAGAVARRLLREFGIEVFSHVLSIGPAKASVEGLQWEEIHKRAEASDLRCADSSVEKKMKAAIDQAQQKGDTIGGTFQVVAWGVPPGLGSYSQWDRRLDGRLAGALMSVPAIKGVEIGLGFHTAATPGSQAHDEIVKGEKGQLLRATNNAGGLEAGLTNGEPILLQAAMKPIPTLSQPLASVNLKTGEPAPAAKERADVCAVPAAGVVAEAMCCLILADAIMEKFGSDTIQEMKRAWENYRKKAGL